MFVNGDDVGEDEYDEGRKNKKEKSSKLEERRNLKKRKPRISVMKQL